MTQESTKQIAVALALLLALGPCAVVAQPNDGMCNALKTVLSETEGHYLRFRGSYDAVYDAYVGTYSIPPMTECLMSAQDESSFYKCAKRLPDDEALARKMLVDTAAAVTQCLGKDVKRTSFKKDASYVWFKHVVGGESIRLKYQRFVPKYTDKAPFYKFSLEVNFLEPN